MEGNFIRWSNVKWDFVRMVSDEMSTNDFCRPPKPVNLMFPGKRDFPSVISMCKKFHGNVTVMKDKGLSDEIGGQWWGKIEPMGVNPDGMLQFFLFIFYWAGQKNLVKDCRETLDCYCVSCKLKSASIADTL